MEAHIRGIFNRNKNKHFLRIVGTKKIPYFRQKIARMTLQDTISAVEKFHTAFKIGNNYSPTVDLPTAEIDLRHRLMSEENEEFDWNWITARRSENCSLADANKLAPASSPT